MNMRYKIIRLITITMVSLVMNAIADDSLYTPADSFFGPPVFLYDVHNYLSKTDRELNRIVIHAGFCNDILQFVKTSNINFNARYELAISVFDKKGNHISSKTFTNEVIVGSFAETNLRRLTNQVSHEVELVAGEYKIVITLTDVDTKKTLRRQKIIKTPEYAFDKINVSEVSFAANLDSETNSSAIITPNLSRNFIEPDSQFGAYFEIYPFSLNDSVIVKYEVTNDANEIVFNDRNAFIPEEMVWPCIINLSERMKQAGRFKLDIEVTQKGTSIEKSEKFSAAWRHVKTEKLDIRQAIKPLKNYVSNKDWRWLQDASIDEKEKWFDNYWGSRDPTPETDKNELMDEFYERVEFANYYFTINALDKDGWDTDRGKVYVKYGQPTSVDRHVQELNVPPYEIWFYATIDRRYVFEDQSGFGDYTLVKIE